MTSYEESEITGEESEINVPWGRIAVKSWGEPSDIPVLVIHGILDNAGSFDPIIHLLPKGYYYYCFDLPGHGKSSHFLPGTPLHFLDYVYTVKLVIEHLSWDKFIIMGHSLGAQISMFYTSLYPERVQRVIFIDGIAPNTLSEDRIVPTLREYFDSLYDVERLLKTKEPPSYSYEEAFNRLINNRSTGLQHGPAFRLLERSLVHSGDGYRYSMDQRLKLHLKSILTMEQIKNIVMNIKCPALLIIAKDTYDLLDDPSGISPQLYILETFLIAKKNFRYVIVEGNHNVHMNDPEKVVPHVIEFLLKTVKSWGEPSDIPVLVIHGILDNAGSFDPIIHLLPKGYYYYCFDLPGHGKSSHFLPGTPLHFLDYVYTVKLVIEHLSWDKFIIMGHSLGAQISMFYTSLYPERVQRVIFIDGIAPNTLSEDRIVPTLRKYFDSLYDVERLLKTKEPPSYSYEEAFNRLINNRSTGLQHGPAFRLLERSLVHSGDGYRYSMDQRLKLHLKPILTMEQMKNIVMNIKCPALLIIAKDTYDLLDDPSGISQHLNRKLVETFLIAKKNFSFAIVEGNHNVHMNDPEKVVPHVVEFLLKSVKSSL